MAQTVAVFGERPIANALGVQSRRLLRAHHARAHRQQRDLVRREVLDQEEAAGDHGDRHRDGARGDQHADQHRVDETQQEQGQEHPGLKAGITAE